MTSKKETKTGYQAESIKVRGGGDYITVAERIQEAHHTDFTPRFEVVHSGPLSLGDVHLWQVTILCEGKRFTATSSINFGGRGADATNPVENAETSALGRALGFAGFGSIGSVASADEVHNAKSRAQAGYQAKAPAQQQKEVKLATDAQKEIIQEYCERAKMDSKKFAAELKRDFGQVWSNMTDKVAAIMIERLGITIEEMQG